MERTRQIVGEDGLQIPLPLMAQYGLHPGSEVTVELDNDVIRIVPRLPSQDEIENRALRLLLRAVGDAVMVKAQQRESAETGSDHGAWRVSVYAHGVSAPLGYLDYAHDGQLLSDTTEALHSIRQAATHLAPS